MVDRFYTDISGVLVTGASGFLAIHCVKLLLKEGYKVKATVRNIKNENKIRYLQDFQSAGHHLEIVEAELEDENIWHQLVIFMLHLSF